MATIKPYAIIGSVLMLAACSGEPKATNEAANMVANAVENTADAADNAANATQAVANGAADEAANAAADDAAKKAEEEAEAKKKKEEAEAKKKAEAEAKPTTVAKVDATPPPAFARCAVCHDATSARQNKIGPELYGAFGKVAGTHAPSYSYSAALKGSGLKWDAATLDKWLENPRALVPGNRMSFPGLKDPAQRQAIIDYLKAQS